MCFLMCVFVLFCFCFWPHCVACRILFPWPGTEPGPSTVKAQSPNHWTTREFPMCFLWFPLFIWLYTVCYIPFQRWNAEFRDYFGSPSLPSEPSTGSSFDSLRSPQHLFSLGSVGLDSGVWSEIRFLWPAEKSGIAVEACGRGILKYTQWADYFCYPGVFPAEVLWSSAEVRD